METPPERPFNITVTVPKSDGPPPDPAEFAVAADQAASQRGADGIISAHTAEQIICVVTVTEATPVAATAIALAVVSDALSRVQVRVRLAPA